jgi:hypothetical protein
MSPPSLRTVFVPPSLVTEFLKSAKKNTKKKIETCGLLLGNLSSSGFSESSVLSFPSYSYILQDVWIGLLL